MLDKIDNVLSLIEKRLIQFLFTAITVTVLISVFNRITLNLPMSWSEELARYLFVWLVYIGAAACSKSGLHIGVTALVDIFPNKLHKICNFAGFLLCAVFSVVLTYTTLSVIKTQIAYGQITPSLRMPMQYPYFGIVIGAVLMFVHYVIHIIRFFKTKPDDTESSEVAR